MPYSSAHDVLCVARGPHVCVGHAGSGLLEEADGPAEDICELMDIISLDAPIEEDTADDIDPVEYESPS